MRTICYIDGFNLYYGLKDAGLDRCKWLDIRGLALSLVRKPFVLHYTKYFTARIRGPHPKDPPAKGAAREASRVRQTIYLEALSTLPRTAIYEGHFLLKRDHCRVCNADFLRPEEKKTDVQIATQLVTDAFLNRFDSAVIVSGDTDLVPPIQSVREHFPQKKIVVAFPPERHNVALEVVANAWMDIWKKTIARCQLPDPVTKSDGVALHCPAEWR